MLSITAVIILRTAFAVVVHRNVISGGIMFKLTPWVSNAVQADVTKAAENDNFIFTLQVEKSNPGLKLFEQSSIMFANRYHIL